MAERFKTGIAELNTVLNGLPIPSGILVQGQPGAGKTVFSFSVAAVKAPRLAILTNNSPTEVQTFLKDLKIDPTDIKFLDFYSWLSGAKADVDSLSNLSRLLVKIEDHLPEKGIVILDSLTPLILYNSGDSVERFLQELIAIVKAKGCIGLFVLDIGSFPADVENTFRALSDGVINLKVGEGLTITKMADTKVPEKAFFYDIVDSGFKLRGK